MTYEPEEDSFLIRRHIPKYAKGTVLDIGTGSGILAIEAAKQKNVKKVFALDIDAEALKESKKAAKENRAKKIIFARSDLFEYFEKAGKKLKRAKFDTILFNPPYLPSDKSNPDVALDGGRKGYELIERFMKNVGKYLAEDGEILMIISSFTKKRKVDEIIKKNRFRFEVLEKQHRFFEDIFLYRIIKAKS